MDEEQASEPGMSGWKRRAVIIWTGQAFSYISTQTATFVVMWHVTASTESAVALALAGLAGLLPAALFSPIGGVAADRYSRKAVVLVADGGAGLVSLAMAFAFTGGVAALPPLIALLAVRATATAFHGPALSAMMPQIVPERHLMGINALDQMLISGSAIAGPVLGALLYSTLGISAALFLDAACAGLACFCLALARIPSHARPQTDGLVGVRAELKEGIACVWHGRGVRMLMLVEMAGMALLMPLGNLEPLMVYSRFGGDSWAASFVEAAFGVGLLLGSWSAARSCWPSTSWHLRPAIFVRSIRKRPSFADQYRFLKGLAASGRLSGTCGSVEAMDCSQAGACERSKMPESISCGMAKTSSSWTT